MGASEYRCPKCRGVARADESRSAYDLTFMQCDGCGYGGLVDSWERDLDWGRDEPSFGCSRCRGEEVQLAWTSSRTTNVRALVQDSHFGIRITACTCGQAFATVFTERIDWVGGEDPQTWLVLPLTPAEVDTLSRTDEGQLAATLTAFGEGRRFLVRDWPSDGTLALWWRRDGFAVGPHD